MRKYIDADKAKELWSGEHPTQIAIRKIFEELPAADVVPKSEVAMEIFEEIESKKLFVRDRIGNMRAVVLFEDIAELKKKYTKEK